MRSAVRRRALICIRSVTFSVGTRACHSIKIGGELSLNKDTQDTLLNNYGVFTFSGAGATNNAFANFLIGIPTGVTQDAPVTAYTNTWYSALFVQDDFRVHRT